MSAAVLLVAKAPVPGQAKTRLARHVGAEAAAELAAAALLDTLDTVEAATVPGDRLLSLAGDLDHACQGAELMDRLAGWQVVPQRGDTFAQRLVAAHQDATGLWGEGRLVVQVGMDTPGLIREDLDALAAAAPEPDRVGLGPATDGGWWGLAYRSVGYVEGLVGVPMSTSDTCRLTRAALEARGATVTMVHALTDVDDLDTARFVGDASPMTRFARRLADAWTGAGPV